MEVDTGSYITVISNKDKRKYFPNEAMRENLQLTSYGNIQLKPLGILTVNVDFNGRSEKVDMYIMEDFSKVLDFTTKNIQRQKAEKFPILVSDTQGTFYGRKISLVFKENVKPIQLKPYHAPFALLPKISAEIDRLVEAVKRYSMPLKEKIFYTLRVGTKWSQIDLKHAFIQFEVDEQSREALTIITHKGLLRYRKLDGAKHVKPLYKALKEKKFAWTDECQMGFDWIKKEITSEKILVLYNSKVKLVLACDASFRSLSAVLSHRYNDSTEKPIASTSKITPKSELHWSQDYWWKTEQKYSNLSIVA
ncbi:uncharacterized protein LOC106647045 [Copidosoma floridanum]|uniref:uncharacterized protein LOC106647045 n=1 Tax=Copidosoma floridanum TaxID=29053 RepID=UPI0006C972A5|nr:uncharacterized protein LOC106647045 [Copidosoma floridanum]